MCIALILNSDSGSHWGRTNFTGKIARRVPDKSGDFNGSTQPRALQGSAAAYWCRVGFRLAQSREAVAMITGAHQHSQRLAHSCIRQELTPARGRLVFLTDGYAAGFD